jgi:hypothetical protein
MQFFHSGLLSKGDLAAMRLRRDQEEILKLHTSWCRARRQANALTLSEEKGHRIPQLQACKVNTDARPRAHTERMKRHLGRRRKRFCSVAFLGRDPALWVEAVMC